MNSRSILIMLAVLFAISCTNEQKKNSKQSGKNKEETSPSTYTEEDIKSFWISSLDGFFNGQHTVDSEKVKVEDSRRSKKNSNQTLFPPKLYEIGKESIQELKKELKTYEVNESFVQERRKTHTLIIEYKGDLGVVSYIEPAKKNSFHSFEYFFHREDTSYMLNRVKVEDFVDGEHD